MRQHEARRSGLWLTILIILPLTLALTPPLALLGLSVWLYVQAASHMPTPQETVFLDRDQGLTRFYDRSGQHEIHRVNDPLGDQRRWLRLADLPPYVVDAALLVEDSRTWRTANRLRAPGHRAAALALYHRPAAWKVERGLAAIWRARRCCP